MARARSRVAAAGAGRGRALLQADTAQRHSMAASVGTRTKSDTIPAVSHPPRKATMRVPHGDLLPMLAFVVGAHAFFSHWGQGLWDWLVQLAGAKAAALLLM